MLCGGPHRRSAEGPPTILAEIFSWISSVILSSGILWMVGVSDTSSDWPFSKYFRNS